MKVPSLQSALERLEARDILRHLNDPELTYLFRHTLVQETVLGSLLNQEQRRLNRLVGECLEALYPDHLDENAVRLAAHFLDAGDLDRGCRYCLSAGEAALHLGALDEALWHFTRALHAAERGSLPVREPYLRRGRVLELRGDFPAALDNYRRFEQWALAHADPASELAALMAQVTIHAIPSSVYNVERGQELSARAIELARALDDPAAEAKIHWNLMLLDTRVSTDYVRGLASGERSLAIARAENLREQLAYTLNDIALLYCFHGDFERGRRANLEARALWREFDNKPMLVDNLNYALMLEGLAGEYAIIPPLLAESLALARATSNGWGEAFAQTSAGQALLELGDVARALDIMREAVRLGHTAFAPNLVFTRSDLARLYGDLGAPQLGLPLARESLELGRAQFPAMRFVATAALAHLQLLSGDLAAAQKTLEGAPDALDVASYTRFSFDLPLAASELALALGQVTRAVEISAAFSAYVQKHGFVGYHVLALLSLGRALAAHGDLDAAASALAQGLELADRIEAHWTRWQLFLTAADVAERRGQPGAAAQFRAQARPLLERILDHVPTAPPPGSDVNLRDTFRNLPAVRRAFADDP